MQFSVLDLEMAAINSTDAYDEVTDILSLDNPLFASGDQQVELIYDLTVNPNLPLDYFGYSDPAITEADPENSLGKEIVFALGADEVLATFGTDQTLTFDNLEHLSALSPDDFLTISLFSNDDSANILWEYAFGLEPVAIFEDGEFSVDEETFEFPVFTPQGDGIDGKVVLKWTIDEGGTLSNYVTESETGIHPNTVSISKKSDVEHTILITVVSSPDGSPYQPGTKVTFGPFKTIAGEPQTIVLSGPETVFADTVDSIPLTAMVYDQFNNKVTDGTPIYWFNDHTGDITTADVETTDGKATAEFTSGSSSQDSEVFVESGTAISSTTISKQKLTLNLTASSTVVDDKETAPLTITATVAGGENVDGLEVFLQSNVSELENNVATVNGGVATFTFYSPGYAAEDVITASVAGVKERINITYNKTGNYADLATRSIVGEATDGYVSVETLSGTVQHSYQTSTELTIYGNPGENYNISPGGLYTPNSSPDLHFSMSEIVPADDFHENQILDQQNDVAGTIVGDVILDRTESYQSGGTSLRFNGGYVNISNADVPDVSASAFANVRFLFDGTNDGILLSKGASGSSVYELVIVEDAGQYYLEARIQTDTMLNTVRSDVVEPGRWYIGGFKLHDGVLTLGLNSDYKSVELQGAIADSSNDLIIGRDYEGYIDDVKIGNEDASKAVITLADSLLTIGSDGKATTTVSATGNIAGFGQRVGFTIANAATVAKLDYQELKFGNKFDAAPHQTIRGQMLASLFGVPMAHADSCSGRRCRANRDSHEQGVAVVAADLFGAVKEWAIKEFVEGAIIDHGKAVGEFIYKLTAVHDMEVIIKSIVALLDDDPSTTVNGFEATFAVVSVGITIFALVTTGPGAIAVSSGLKGLKGVLRLVWNEVGPGAILNLGTIVVKGMVNTLKKLVTNPASVGRSLVKIGSSLGVVISGSIDGARQLFFNIRSKKQFDDFVEIFGSAGAYRCFASNDYWNGRVLPAQLVVGFPFYIDIAYAADPCRSFPKVLGEMAYDTLRFGDQATAIKAAQSVMDIAVKYGTKFDELSEDAIQGLAYFAYVRQAADNSAATALDRIGALFKGSKFPVEEVNTALEMVNTISRMGDGFLRKNHKDVRCFR
jgi:hypothetical protein